MDRRATAARGRVNCEDPVEYVQSPPADETIKHYLVRTVSHRPIPSAQPVADDKDDPADDPTVINPWNVVR